MDSNNTAAHKIELARQHEQFAQYAAEFIRLNIPNPTERDHEIVKHCLLAGASIAIAGLEKFKKTLIEKSQN